MPTTGPNFGMIHSYASRESGWNVGMDANLKKLDTIVMCAVKNDLNTPPGSPANGDRYIVGVSPTGTFVGHVNQIAVWDSGASAWTFYTAKTGWFVYHETAVEYWKYVGGSWNSTGI